MSHMRLWSRARHPRYAIPTCAEQAVRRSTSGPADLTSLLTTRSGILQKNPVDDVSFSLRRGETLAIFVDSGCCNSMNRH